MNIFQLGVFILVALLHCSYASERIIGAQTGTISQFPYLAQLQRRVGNTVNFQYYCTGALVSSTRLVTAAHCFDGIYNNHPSQWRIRVGATNQLGTEATAYAFDPTEILIHGDYNSQTFDNDLAVVTWQFPIWTSLVVDFIELNDDAVPAFGQVTIAGWGGTNLAGAISNPLQFAHVPSIDLAECRMNYAWLGRIVTDNMMCAGTTGRGSCTNDRGLPLIYNGVLAGVSSWRVGCGVANQPGVFSVVLSDNPFLMGALGLEPPVEPPVDPTVEPPVDTVGP